MTGEIIKSFLVGLGFDVDEKSLGDFNKSIAGAALKITALYASIQAASAGIFASIAGVSQGFEDMGYQLRIVAPAMNRWLVMRQAMLDAYSHAGVDLSKTVQQAILFNYSLAKTKFALEAVYKSVAAKFFPLLTKQMDIFRQKIFANMPKIQSSLMKFVQFIFKAFQATVELGTRLWSILTRVWDFFVKLDKATGGWSTAILGVVAAWKVLNLSFLATPFGVVLAGLLAILALYDDFKTFQEGGKSLFDWGPVIPIINSITDAISGLYKTISSLVAILFDVALAFKQAFSGDFSGALDSLKRAGEDVIAVFTNLGGVIKDVASTLGGIGGIVADKFVSLFGGSPGKALPPTGVPGSPGFVGPNQPLLPNSSSSQTHVQQETNININGAADANSVGKNVAGHQDRVNFDMTRNIKGSTQ